MYYLYFFIYIAMTCSGLLFMKLGSDSTSMEIDHRLLMFNFDYRFLLGIFFYGCSFLIYALVLQKKDISYVYPLCAGVINIVSTVLGIIVFHEKISGWNWIGLFFIVLGVVALSIGRG